MECEKPEEKKRRAAVASGHVYLPNTFYLGLYRNFLAGKYLPPLGTETFLDDILRRLDASALWRARVVLKGTNLQLRSLRQKALHVHPAPYEKDYSAAVFTYPADKTMLLRFLGDRTDRIEFKWPLATCYQSIFDWLQGLESRCARSRADECLEATVQKWRRQILGKPTSHPTMYTYSLFVQLFQRNVFLQTVSAEGEHVFLELTPQALEEHASVAPTIEQTANGKEAVFADPEVQRAALIWCLYRDFVHQHIDVLRFRLLGPKARMKGYPELFAGSVGRGRHIAPLRSLLQPTPIAAAEAADYVEGILESWHQAGQVHTAWYHAWHRAEASGDGLFAEAWADVHALVQALLHAKRLSIDELRHAAEKARGKALPTLAFFDPARKGAKSESAGFAAVLLRPFVWSAQTRSRLMHGGGDDRWDRELVLHILRIGVRDHVLPRALRLLPADGEIIEMAYGMPEVADFVTRHATRKLRFWLEGQREGVREAEARGVFAGYVARFFDPTMPALRPAALDRLWETVLRGALKDVHLRPDDPRIANGQKAWKGLIIHPQVPMK